jgi:Zn-dependent peptidase ImmA (M78 family)/transcriptional regulator with XRE-family HTH domain
MSNQAYLFVRSQDSLAPYVDGAKGRVYVRDEALRLFGEHLLNEADEYGSAPLSPSLDEPSRTLRERRQAMGLEREDLAKFLSITVPEVERAEDPGFRTPFRVLKRICEALGIDDFDRLTAVPLHRANEAICARFKAMAEAPISVLRPVEVLRLSQLAGVVHRFGWLTQEVGTPEPPYRVRYAPSGDYGNSKSPAWKKGHDLAALVRRKEGLSADAPIPHLRDLCARLGVPVLLESLPDDVFGVCIASGAFRGIVVNRNGSASSPLVQRATIAHELGHVLFDPTEQMGEIRIDSQSDIDTSPYAGADFVEQRANAFAFELLAPRKGVLKLHAQTRNHIETWRKVVENYGVSAIAAKYVVWNATGRGHDLTDFKLPRADYQALCTPSDHWRAVVSWTDDFFPIQSTPSHMRGEVAGLTVAAEQLGKISEFTAAEFLHCSVAQYRAARRDISEIFADAVAILLKSPPPPAEPPAPES